MKVIQRDEIGKGLLIEHDGWILKEDNEGFLNEMHKLEIGDKNISDPLYVYAVLQKYDTENKNGRWYPKEILYRENERYQSLIKTRSSIGELNHPDCVDKNHEILTINGWKSIVDVKEGDMVLTFNTETETSEYQPVKRKIEQFYEGFMYEIKGKMLEKTVTPNHRFLMEDRHKKGYFYETIQEIVDNPINRMVVKKSVFDDSNFRDDEYITLKDCDIKKIYHKDMVYCVEVDNSNFYIRKNGKSCFTGNSSNISLKPTDASHIIVETFWKGKTLLGKLEILTSPGFIKNGIISCSGDFVANLLRKNILIGVSSRGVGSLKKEGNKNLVQDDFELVCWDIVAQPSTPGSYIFTDMERATKLWVEEEDKEQNLENKRMESMKRFLGF